VLLFKIKASQLTKNKELCKLIIKTKCDVIKMIIVKKNKRNDFNLRRKRAIKDQIKED
jgi:hypothetical protein